MAKKSHNNKIDMSMLEDFREKLELEFPEEIITFNYAEVKKTRRYVRKIVELMTGTERGAYEYANPYIGAGTTNLILHDVNISQYQMNTMKNLIDSGFPDAFVAKIFRDLKVYWRGAPR